MEKSKISHIIEAVDRRERWKENDVERKWLEVRYGVCSLSGY